MLASLVVLISAGKYTADAVTSGSASERALSGARIERCADARAGLVFYRFWRRTYLERMGRLMPAAHRAHGCDQTRSMAKVARRHARGARQALNRWLIALVERLQNPTYAICYVFGEYCTAALKVASCESGRAVYAQNGQYLGMFQMGSYARGLYGHDNTALGQARAAYRYFVASGRDWSPWSCKPW